jgi:hypothetical protein
MYVVIREAARYLPHVKALRVIWGYNQSSGTEGLELKEKLPHQTHPNSPDIGVSHC